MQAYKWDAVNYAKSSAVQQLWAQELIRKLDLKGNERVLDIGCGDGKVTSEIAAHVPYGSVLGIDSSKDMISLARRQFPEDAFPHLCFEYGDAQNLLFRGEFDIVFSNATLHWMLDHRPVLRGIFDSLKHGGKALIQMGGKGNAAKVLSALDGIIQTKEWNKYFEDFTFPYGFFSADEYRKLLNDAGLRLIRVELIPKVMVQQGRNGLEAWIQTTWLPYTQRVPEEKRNLFITQMAEVYLNQHPAEIDGKIHIQMVRLEVEALKQ